MGWKEAIGALMGVSAFAADGPAPNGYTIDDDAVKRARRAFGGQLSPLPQTQTRWYLADLETAIYTADSGNLADAARLYRSFRRDGVLSGLLSTRTSGLVRLPKRFRGNGTVTQMLERRDGIEARPLFDDMCPSAELALLAADGIALGVGLAELVPVPGRDFPVLVRLDPENLRYRWQENRWYYQSVAGPIAIEPGLGRWVLHVPGGRTAPWQNGLWSALGQAWINKQHAVFHRSNYSAKLANPARAAFSPAGTNEEQKQGFLQGLIAWGVNTVFDLPPGWDVKIIESNGRGYEVFQAEIDTCDNEMIIALAGQMVTTTGGTGFANADIHKSIRADLIKETADALAYTLNTQVLPSFVLTHFGEEILDAGGAVVEWDVTPPKDVKNEADSLKSFGEALTSITQAMQPYKRYVDIGELASRFAIPIAQDSDGDGVPDAQGAGDDAAIPEPVEEPTKPDEAAE